MADLTGYNKVFTGDTAKVDVTDKTHELGTRAYDDDGNEYIYLTGATSTVAGTWVTYDEAHLTTLAVADAKGRVAIAMAATDATTDFGWYQIYGKNTIALITSVDAVANNAPLYLHASAGRIGDTDVAGDLVNGAVSRGVATNTASPLTVEISYPFVNDSADD